MAGEEIATCPSCSLIVKIIYDPHIFLAEQDEVKMLQNSLKKMLLEPK